jgi:hypothetical protein
VDLALLIIKYNDCRPAVYLPKCPESFDDTHHFVFEPYLQDACSVFG